MVQLRKVLMYNYIYICILLYFITISAFSEGTKELRPAESDWGNIEINDQGRPFAKEDCDSLHKLYIHIKSTTETIYFGFQPNDKTLGTGTYRLVDPQGNIVVSRTDVPVATGAGYIETYAEACAGPKIGGIPAGGYNPLSYSPLTTGDYYIEFTQNLGADITYYFDLFDITVVDATNTPILGRLWSHAWDLSARDSKNRMRTVFYIYTGDKYISSVNLNGIQPFGFVISSNSTGTSKTTNLFYDRQSVAGNSTYPEFKLFLNLPDISVYEIADPPTMIEDLKVLGSPLAEHDVLFYLNMNKAGTIEIFLDLDETPGYQPNGKDRVLVKTIKAGGDTIVWNAKDGLGDWVTQSVTVDVSSRFSTGVTHLPLFDPEYHTNGFIVNRILPNSERATLYWDDSRIPSLLGTVEFEGVSGDTDGHNFPDTAGGFGNLRTINTWWNGFENNDLKSFMFTMDGTSLPITLSTWKAISMGAFVQLEWTTLSEANNELFEIQRSHNGIEWELLETLPGAFTSNILVQYKSIDPYPLPNISYYRLKQIDIQGTYSYSEVVCVYNTIETASPININYKASIHTITIEAQNISHQSISVRTLQGQDITQCIIQRTVSDNCVELFIKNLETGMYLIQTQNYTSRIYIH